ncbi:trans-aconitate 2-methyltransferase [Mycolicibacterium cyprinidarum]|uniref:Trans-aconitate 2-methyltransferase n=1 Tax=Mycolicibacterium cyprinidarum TaxID=2860311 RepID=A0ABQ4VBK9_9MYCO|nr:trans-aconitate 2-methyltransferase [Mycolicibacterium sp. NGTWSNA01]GJF19361.1 trans-aconitate 2-methyltransferase [Mycolicibacterium sp. NGTWS0302]
MWSPDVYLAYAGHRGRPFFDLLSRVGARNPRRVADLGCGPGNLTATLTNRWPGAGIEAWDSSPEMVEVARERGVPARVGDVRDWIPGPDIDVVVSNAVLQWVPEHPELLVRWVGQLTVGSWLAFQVPDNFDEPSHQSVRDLVSQPQWSDALQDFPFRESDIVQSAAGYAALLSEAGCSVDAWETTYVHELTGADPVLEWITGTALRPVRSSLSDEQWGQFRAELVPMLDAFYPMRADGTTFFPFRRVFVVAQVN